MLGLLYVLELAMHLSYFKVNISIFGWTVKLVKFMNAIYKVSKIAS